MTEEYGHISDGFFLSEKEIEDLRKSKRELTEYAKEKLRKLMNHEDMLELAEQRERSNRILQRYNDFYNKECASLPTGGPISMENLQALTLDCMISAIRCEYLNREYNEIAISDIEDLIEGLYQQGKDYLQRVNQRVEEFKDSADGVA